MILRWAVASMSVGLLLCAAIGILAVEGALHPARLPISESDHIRAQTIASRSHAALTDVEIIAEG